MFIITAMFIIMPHSLLPLDPVNILPLYTFRVEDVNLVLSWEFSANQNRAFNMQRRLANLCSEALGWRILTYLMAGGGEDVNLNLAVFLSNKTIETIAFLA